MRMVGMAFGDGSHARHALDVWASLNMPGRPVSRATVYRAFSDLEDRGVITVSAIVGSRTLYQLDCPRPLIHLVDVAQSQVRTIEADDFVRQISKLVQGGGYRLAGGVDIRVVPVGE